MVLYRLLDLKDWKVDDKAINAAYKRVAVKYHPDKVYAENREAANARMTKINAAKDVLVDDEARNK
jgi:DnaJ-class molecular chaperone